MFEPPVGLLSGLGRLVQRRCQRSARRVGASAALGEAGRLGEARESRHQPALCCGGRVAGKRDEEALACLVRPLRVDRSRTSRYRRWASSVFPDAAAIRASWTRACAATQGAWAVGCRKRLPLELLGLAQIAVRDSDRSKSSEPNAAWSPNPVRPPSSNARLYASAAASSSPRSSATTFGNSAGHETRRIRAHPVTAGDRGHRGDRRDVAGVRRPHCANEAARCYAPVVSSRLERGPRVVRHRGSAFHVAQLPKGEREHQLREAALPRCRTGRRPRPHVRRPRALGRNRTLRLRCSRSAVRSSIRRNVIVRGRKASSRKRRPSETRSARVPAQRAEPNRDGRVGRVASVIECSPEIVVFQLQEAFPAQPFRRSQLDARLVGECREAFGMCAAGRREPAALGETLEHVLADRVEHVVAGGAAGERGRHDRLVDQRCNEIRDGGLVEAVPRCERDERRQGRRRRGGRPAAGAASSRPRATGRSSIPRALAARYGPGPRPGCHAGAPRAAQGWRRAPRARARSPARRRARSPAAIRQRAARNLGSERNGLGVWLESGSCRAPALEEKLDGRGLERRHGESHFARDVGASRLVARIRAAGRSARTVDAIRAASSAHVLARVENEESRCVV